MAASCPRNAWNRNGKNWFKGKEWVGVGRVDVEKRAIM